MRSTRKRRGGALLLPLGVAEGLILPPGQASPQEDHSVNLLEETAQELQWHGKSPADVRWVGSQNGVYAISWEEFAAIAQDVTYNPRSGTPHIATDLVVVGDDWWLERHVENGNEWWEFKTLPQPLPEPKPFSHVFSPRGFWPTIAQLHHPTQKVGVHHV